MEPKPRAGMRPADRRLRQPSGMRRGAVLRARSSRRPVTVIKGYHRPGPVLRESQGTLKVDLSATVDDGGDALSRRRARWPVIDRLGAPTEPTGRPGGGRRVPTPPGRAHRTSQSGTAPPKPATRPLSSGRAGTLGSEAASVHRPATGTAVLALRWLQRNRPHPTFPRFEIMVTEATVQHFSSLDSPDRWSRRALADPSDLTRSLTASRGRVPAPTRIDAARTLEQTTAAKGFQ